MADFSFNSDSSDEEAVEELLNQAKDHSILEQIAKINCSSFSSDSVLPTHLENRFSGLKSFPVSKLERPNFDVKERFGSQFGNFFDKKHNPDSDDELEKTPVRENELKQKSRSRSGYFLSKSSRSMGKGKLSSKPKLQLHPDDEFGEDVPKRDSPSGSDYFSSKSTISSEKRKISSKGRGLEKNLASGFGSSRSNSSLEDVFKERKGIKLTKKGTGSFLSRSNSSDSSPSPPKRSSCFWCSPKKDSVKKNRGNRGFDGELLSDLSILSAKNQEKLLEMSMREEENIKHEAEKIVKLVKQGSARMNISNIDD